MEQKMISEKIEQIENEIIDLKDLIAKGIKMKPKKIISLKGILEKISISEEEIKEAKSSLFKTGS